ncbi:LysE family translocator [Achromobacter piechaudii]|uniref:Homoserine/homoserine lactone efflux protein n=1 Tax=Achromobacter piechaudii TaxID=72556 RepID=A0ABM8KT19_9BURK|nr:LysE family translocator [Achromobacter piechaudii]KNY11597.1 amino acid transporter [Achromobacter piechaudii]CAB3669418.1 Homoserine/homoserine lactone efflux protein [Achromobacter piechaudii]CAB3833794.1 Homoserine/homoserine lactone efflux protein [Achromobacter piechaudii]CAB3943550.1 Homoserine/homoserine lactone efflux protein [Achromobacter piechaudii]
MSTATLLLFVLASAIAIVTPGPTTLLAMSNGSRHGVRAAGWGMAGAVLADLILIGAVASGLGVVLAASEIAFQIIKWVGAAYLAYLGWKMLRSDAALVLPSASSTARPASLALGMRSFLVALTNPKALLFMSAFLPQFIDPQAPLLIQYAIVAAVMATINTLTMVVYAMLGAQLVRAFQGSGLRWLNRVCGSLMMGLAATLALYRRGAG